MSTDSTPTVPDLLGRLAEGFSQQNRIATSYWIALAIVAALSLIPSPLSGKIALPFLSVEVSTADFYPFATILISLLIVGYGSSNVQVTRTRRLVHKYLDSKRKSGEEFIVPATIHLQDVFDSITTPSINRVAPLAQILQGQNQFYPEASKRSLLRSIIASIYFVLLRGVGMLTIEVFPGYALAMAFLKGNLIVPGSNPWGIPVIFFWAVGAVAYIILIQLLVIDVLFGIRSVKRICAGSIKSDEASGNVNDNSHQEKGKAI
jgi:hypothetical protein